jgi:hypothetical protein
LGCEIAYLENRGMEGKVTKFQHVCVCVWTIKRCLKSKTRKNTLLKVYKPMAVPVLPYGAETWSLTKVLKEN